VRKVSIIQVVVLFLCLAGTGALIHLQPVNIVVKKNRTLQDNLQPLSEKYVIEKIPLSPRIVEELKLDDFIFQTYMKNKDSVSLYVGYYFTGKKVGAAHDPQVCYPGQGWKLSNKQTHSYSLENGEEIHYSSIIAESDGKKELIYYWFQVDDETAAGTLSQKIILFQKRILHEGESNAFVRISTSLDNRSVLEAESLLLSFIADFYPAFYRYSTEN